MTRWRQWWRRRRWRRMVRRVWPQVQACRRRAAARWVSRIRSRWAHGLPVDEL